MFHSHLIRRTLQIGACGAAIVLCTVPGNSAEPAKATKGDKAACKTAYKNAQASEQASRLRDAKEQYLACSKVACGAFLRPECTTKYTQLTSDIPSVIPVVTDENGNAVAEVQLKVDGETVTSRLDGRAIEVDPGMHEFVFTSSAGVIATQKMMVVAGQRNSPIAVSTAKGGRRLAASVTIPQTTSRQVEPKATPEKPSSEATAPRALVSEKAPPTEESAMDAPPETAKSGGPGPWPWIIGGAGLAAVGTSVMLSVWGQKDNNSLSNCTPNCSTDSVQHIKNLYTAADIALGVGVVALGVSTYLFATSGSSSKEKPPAKSASYKVDVQPTAGGAFATVSGAF